MANGECKMIRNYGYDHRLGQEAISGPILSMVGVSPDEYQCQIGNNEIAAIAGTVIVPIVVTNVLHNVCLHDPCSVSTWSSKRTEGYRRNTDNLTLPA